MSLLTPSGGLIYHLRAARYRSSLWAAFRAELGTWLRDSFTDQHDELLLIGPSAAHCLPIQWLRRFGRLTVVEPDPVARALLAVRVGRHFEQERRDLLLAPLLSGSSGLEAVLRRRPRASVLFCNVLGQLHFGLSDGEQLLFQARFAERIVPELVQRRWASFHDRWSLDTAVVSPRPSLRFEHRPLDEELGVSYFGSEGPAVTVLDHGTGGLFPAQLPHRYFSWQITPAALHVIEAVAG
jgi:hypothetical protein